MLNDILADTWAFKELKKEARKEGLKEGLLKGLRQGVVTLVQARFPQLVKLAQERVNGLQKAEDVQKLLVDLSMMQDEEQAKQALLAIEEVKKRRRKAR